MRRSGYRREKWDDWPPTFDSRAHRATSLSTAPGTPMTTDRIHNFSAGPAALPESVLRKAQEAIWNVAGSGIGIMEHSHRGKTYEAVHNEAIALTRELLAVPDDYDVLLLQGGASGQFAMVPVGASACSSRSDCAARSAMRIASAC